MNTVTGRANVPLRSSTTPWHRPTAGATHVGLGVSLPGVLASVQA